MQETLTKCKVGASYSYTYSWWLPAIRNQQPRPGMCLTPAEFADLRLEITRIHVPWGALDEYEPQLISRLLDYLYPADIDIILGVRFQHPVKTTNPITPTLRDGLCYPARDINEFYNDMKTAMKEILIDPRIKYVQFGNEPRFHWKGSVEEWAAQVKAGAWAVYETNPDIKVLTGGSVNPQWIVEPESDYHEAIILLWPKPGDPVVPNLMIDVHYYSSLLHELPIGVKYLDKFMDRIDADYTVTETAPVVGHWSKEIKEEFFYRNYYANAALVDNTLEECRETAYKRQREIYPLSLLLPENLSCRRYAMPLDAKLRISAFQSSPRCRAVLWWGISGWENNIHPHWADPIRKDIKKAWKELGVFYPVQLASLILDDRKQPHAEVLKQLISPSKSSKKGGDANGLSDSKSDQGTQAEC